MKCKNCGHELQAFGSPTAYNGIRWHHAKEGKNTRNERGQLTEKKECACGCTKPEPKKAGVQGK